MTNIVEFLQKKTKNIYIKLIDCSGKMMVMLMFAVQACYYIKSRRERTGEREKERERERERRKEREQDRDV